MENIEYGIVGGGYAGIFLAHQCIVRGKSFVLFDEGKSSASKISAGMVNPVVLKKFTTFWKAKEQIEILEKTMGEMARYLGENFFVKELIHRIFHDEKEQQLWQKKRQNPELNDFLEEGAVVLPQIENEYGCGRVLQGGYVKVSDFFERYYQCLRERGHWKQEKFDYEQLNIPEKTYGRYRFENIIFCEGVGVKHNPFFRDMPIKPNKGHQLEVIFSEDLGLNTVVKKKHFLIPISNGKYYYGGTYDRLDTDEALNPISIEQLRQGLNLITSKNYIVERENFAFRPTVADRRPIIGEHSEIPYLYIFNGLGARGLLNGAYFSPILMDYIEGITTLPDEVSLKRF